MTAPCVGNCVNVGIGIDNPNNPNNPNRNPNLTRVVADMSDSQVSKMKKRCIDVLNNSGSYDRDLRQLCLLISRR